jgi:hypothetical protein
MNDAGRFQWVRHTDTGENETERRQEDDQSSIFAIWMIILWNICGINALGTGKA